MPCKKIAPTGDKRPPFRTAYATEAECNQACREGACCEGTTCSVKPQCQCQGTGKVFKGVGTTCAGTGVCCSASSASTGTGVQSCSVPTSICDCGNAKDVKITTPNATCSPSPCVSCPCTSSRDFPVSITVECHAKRSRIDRVCGFGPQEALYYAAVDRVYTQTLYFFSSSGIQCKNAYYESRNSREFTQPGRIGGSMTGTDGLEANGVRFYLERQGSQCIARGFSYFFVGSPNSSGTLAVWDQIGGAISGGIPATGNANFWDSLVGVVIGTGYEQSIACFDSSTLKDESTMTIKSVSYLP